MKLLEMDERGTFSEQLEEDVGAVIVISKFNIKPDDVRSKRVDFRGKDHKAAAWIHIHTASSRYCR
jgi:D-Tyr-tRNAtyr deacylase